MSRLSPYVIAVVLVVTGCGTSPESAVEATTTLAPVETSIATYATITEPTSTPTTVLTTTGTTSPTTPTTTIPTATTVATPAIAVPTLPDGRPTTFLAVRSDYVALELTTSTGQIVHEFGHTGTPEDFDDDQEIAPNVVTAAVRLRDGSMVGIIDCCEPAGGRIFYVPAGGQLDSSSSGTDGWTLTPSPVTAEFARLGYLIGVFDPRAFTDDRAAFFVDDTTFGFPSGQVAWRPDGQTIYWVGVEFGGGPTTLNTIDLSADSPVPVVIGELEFVGADQFLGNIATQVSGNLVGFLHTQGDGDITSSVGVVFNPLGELLNTFPIETGSLLGSYDSTGKYLIYVDGDGVVRWQGRGQSGELAYGYIHASW